MVEEISKVDGMLDKFIGDAIMAAFGLPIPHDDDEDRATRAATLKQKHNLGYADAFAAELAIEHGAWLVSADPEFAKVGKALSVYPLPRHEK